MCFLIASTMNLHSCQHNAQRHQFSKSYTSSSRSSSSSSPSSSSSSSSTSGSSFLGAVVRFGRADAGGDAPFSSSATSSRQLAIGRCASTSELSSSLMAANHQILASSQCFFTQFPPECKPLSRHCDGARGEREQSAYQAALRKSPRFEIVNSQ